MLQQIAHYTINTGHGRLTDRSEVAIETLALLGISRRGSRLLLPHQWRVDVARGTSGGWLYSIHHGQRYLVECGLAVDDAQAAEVWPPLYDAARRLRVVHPDRPPRAPWLAIVTTFLMDDAEEAGMAADLERCVAWYLIDEDPRNA